MNKTNTAKDLSSPARSRVGRNNWLFEVEPHDRSQPETLQDLQENFLLKKHLRRAVSRDLAPLSLIESIRAGIRK
jgi:hypothetical protein